MPRQCDLTGKSTRAGRNVSHSNRKTNRRFDPNLKQVHLESQALGRRVALRVSTRALRSVQKRGGLDAYLLSTPDPQLTPQALRLKHRVRRATS
jgi:large subunit ribosomal protein L28